MAQQFITARAAALLGHGAGRILLGGCTADPGAVLEAVIAEPDLWQGSVLTGAFIPGVNERDYAAIGQQTIVETIFATAGLRRGEVRHLPLHYADFAARLARPGIVDLIYTTVPPPAPDGSIGYGLTCDFVPAAVAAGARLVGVVNPRMPDLPQTPRVPGDRFAALVWADAPLPELPEVVPDPQSLAIADHIIGVLRPGDTLQCGLGKVQTALLARLAGAGLTDLGYHAGMISPGILPLIRAGVFARGVTTGVVLGGADFYAQAATITDLRMQPVSLTHANARLAAIPALVAVNSVIEVDLSGQANAEYLEGQQISGQGGMVDFIRGARASQGGRSILALPATAAGGTKSRIVAALPQGTPVSVARADVDMVVTEYGVAHLREASVSERVRRLAAIAAPGFRDALVRNFR